MRYLRVAGHPPVSVMPAAFQVIADSSAIEQARLLDWNLGSETSVTVFYAIDGDCQAAREALLETPEATDVSATTSVEPRDDHPGAGYLLVRLDRSAHPLLRGVFDVIGTEGLIVLKPLVYQEGRVSVRLVGESAVLEAVVDRLPDTIETTIQTVGSEGSLPISAAPFQALSARQREAVETALELGYYEQPQQATHKAVAKHLDCAPSTASEQLQKAEAKLVRAAVNSRNP